MAISAIPRLSISQWLFLALAGLIAHLCGTAVHELGHGVVALLLGGEFHDLFIGVLSGEAGASAPGAGNAVVLAAGSLSEIAAGALAWWWLRKRIRSSEAGPDFDFTAILLWLFATQAVLDSLVYVSIVPAVQALFGAATGDWPLLLASQPFIRSVLLLLGAIVIPPLSAAFLKDAPRRLQVTFGHTRPPGKVQRQTAHFVRQAIISYGLLLLPSVLLRSAFALALAPWLDGPVAMALGSTGDILLFVLPGALWLVYRMPRSSHRPGSAHTLSKSVRANRRRLNNRIRTHAWRWNALLLLFAASLLLVFGPSEPLRRGLALSPPTGDQYIGTAQRIRLLVRTSESGTPVVTLYSRPVPTAGSRYRRRLTEALATRGPSTAGARQLATFIARWNLDGAQVGDVSEPHISNGEWQWQFDLVRSSNPMEVALWPATWNRESHIEELRIEDAGLSETGVPNIRLEGGDRPTIVWSRPVDMENVQRFNVHRGKLVKN